MNSKIIFWLVFTALTALVLYLNVKHGILLDEFNECTGGVVEKYAFTASPGSGKILHRLNVRKNEPTTKTDVVEIVNPGSTITYSGFATNGQPVNGNAKWFKNEAGNYFWSGAIE
jgi:hypothetical protein